MLGAKVLLVEDERIVAHHLQRQLTSLGYDVAATVSNGARALQVIHEERPALVLMDINIEGDIDGIETASRIPDDYHIPIIYLTAYSEESTLERARATRPYGFLLKPFTDRELHATIQMALERRETELALRASEERLRQAQKMEVIGQLAGGVAHDFNNLLAIIGGNLELVRETIPDGYPGVAEMLQDAQDATARGASLTQQLLAYSRRQPLAPQVVNAGDLISGLIELLGRTLGETIRIRTRTAPDLWPARVDPRQLENAILNLAVNARDAMPDGGCLTIEVTNVELDEHYADQQIDVTPGAYVMLAVSDSGTGMTPDVVAKALEPFFTTKPVGHGTGLGLSMVYGFVKQSNGHIKIYSEPGNGTTVKIYLPRVEGEADRAAGRNGAGVPSAQPGETVLVVEDDTMVRKLAVRLLTGLGYEVIEAEHGPAALLRAAEPVRIDLLLTDVILPEGMNGAMLAQKMRDLRPGLKTVFMSGYAADAISNSRILDAGVPLLSKPFRKAELAAKLRDVLDAEQAA